jgi:hypothetical protein
VSIRDTLCRHANERRAFRSHTRQKGATVIKDLQTNYFGLSPGGVRPPPPHTSTLIVARGHDKNVPLHILLHAMAWATQTVVLGGQGHEIQSKPTDVVLDAVASFLKLNQGAPLGRQWASHAAQVEPTQAEDDSD